ncbi:MAG: hypothetical protein ACFFER_08620 [Candidatus Thorarchaeota archaeon]
MTPKEDLSPDEMLELPDPESAQEKLLWVLTVMEHSAEVRKEHFRYRDLFNKDFISDKVEFDVSGKLVKNKDMYGAIHADYIFSVIRNIESFHGALAASYELTKDAPDHNKVIDILMNPTNHRGGIISFLGKDKLKVNELCRLMCIPKLMSWPSPEEREALKRLLHSMFDHFSLYAFSSLKYWDMFQNVRHVYAHNYRFLFYDEVMTGHRKKVDETVIGFINPPDPTEHESVYIGFIQRVAMGELASRLNGMERWVYTNMRLCVKNGGKPMLPPSIGFLNKKQEKEYRAIWKSQNYMIEDPVQSTKMDADVGSQITLHMGMLREFANRGFVIKTVDQKGRERVMSFQELDRIFSELTTDEKLKAKLDEIRSKRRKRHKRRRVQSYSYTDD